MRFLTGISVFLCSLLLLSSVSHAFETDQFNLPRVPLADIGEEVSEYLIESLKTAVETVNTEIANSETCLVTKTKDCDSPEIEGEKLDRLRSDEAIAAAFSKLIAGNRLMTTKFGKWMNSHEFSSQPARYKAAYSESIYILNPLDYATLSPTVHLYGHEFGIDKLEHLFQQGHQYYNIYNAAVKQGATPPEATQKAIKWGQKTERTYYGLWISGVYSNADLYANYVGLKTYQRLASPIIIGEKRYNPLFERSNGRWEARPAPELLKPFISDHMNEALNPSSYRITLFASVRRVISKNACREWQKLSASTTSNDLDSITNPLTHWNNEDYGFTPKDRTIRVPDLCFDTSTH